MTRNRGPRPLPSRPTRPVPAPDPAAGPFYDRARAPRTARLAPIRPDDPAGQCAGVGKVSAREGRTEP